MKFKVPQFIDHEAKIVGPLTIKQFGVVGSVGVVCLILFFFLGENLLLWMMISGILLGTALSLVFIQVQGMPLLTLIVKSISFFAKPKTYVWKKRAFSTKIKSKNKKITGGGLEEKEVKKQLLKSRSGLDELSSQIEIK